jgi:hypothetical protein
LLFQIQLVPLHRGDNYAFVSKQSGNDGTYTTTAADDNLRAALGISKDSTDSEMLMKSLDQRKWWGWAVYKLNPVHP